VSALILAVAVAGIFYGIYVLFTAHGPEADEDEWEGF